MRVGGTIKGRIQELGRSQKQVAMEWVERHGDSLSKDTAESQLSRCCKDDLEGLKFFFGQEPRRGELLLEILDFGADERAEITKKARQAIEAAARPATRMVIVLTSLENSGASALQEVASRVLVVEALLPAVLIVTQEQQRELRALPAKVFVESVAGKEAGRARADELGTEGALLVSAERHLPCERWVAMALDNGRLAFEPEDWMAAFKRDQVLPAPRQVEHDLEDLGVQAEERALPTDPRTLRRALMELADEGLANRIRPGLRLAWARALGVRATSTRRERLEHALRRHRELIVPKGSLDEVKEEARRRSRADLAVWEGECLYVVNPTGDVSDLETEGAKVCQVECPTPALTRVLDTVSGWTADDYLDDPCLLKMIERLVAEGVERDAATHAAAFAAPWLAGEKQLPPLSDGTGLEALLAHEVPAALLWFKALDRVAPRAAESQYAALSVPPLGNWLVGRSDDLVTPRIPNAPRPGPQPGVEEWLTAWEGWRARTSWDRERERSEGRPFRVAPEVWVDADLQLALVWSALRRSLARSTPVRLHDGRLLLPLRDGLFAEARVRPGGSQSPRGGLSATIADGYERPARAELRFETVVTHVGYANVGTSVPHRVYLEGAGLRADVRFLFSALHMGGEVGSAVASGLSARKVEDERVQEDEYT